MAFLSITLSDLKFAYLFLLILLRVRVLQKGLGGCMCIRRGWTDPVQKIIQHGTHSYFRQLPDFKSANISHICSLLINVELHCNILLQFIFHHGMLVAYDICYKKIQNHYGIYIFWMFYDKVLFSMWKGDLTYMYDWFANTKMDSLVVEYVSNFSYEKTGDSLYPQWIGVLGGVWSHSYPRKARATNCWLVYFKGFCPFLKHLKVISLHIEFG